MIYVKEVISPNMHRRKDQLVMEKSFISKAGLSNNGPSTLDINRREKDMNKKYHLLRSSIIQAVIDIRETNRKRLDRETIPDYVTRKSGIEDYDVHDIISSMIETGCITIGTIKGKESFFLGNDTLRSSNDDKDEGEENTSFSDVLLQNTREILRTTRIYGSWDSCFVLFHQYY